MRFRPAHLLLILTVVLVSACGKPLPVLRADYIGHWQGDNVDLMITRDGMVAYTRRGKGMNTRINAPITGFKGDDFVVGIWFFTTTFVVSEPPHQVDGHWRMVVDGVRLSRTGAAPGARPGSGKQKFTCSECSPLRAA